MVEEETKKPAQELEDVNLVEEDATKVPKVGAELDLDLKEKIVELNVDPTKNPVKQKQWVFALERNKAVVEEVEKFLTAGFIREVY